MLFLPPPHGLPWLPSASGALPGLILSLGGEDPSDREKKILYPFTQLHFRVREASQPRITRNEAQPSPNVNKSPANGVAEASTGGRVGCLLPVEGGNGGIRGQHRLLPRFLWGGVRKRELMARVAYKSLT
ncbi:hypothetical protein FB451DRAFT_1164330 [Mycena latifolia]|nr:hypothetical protein FB451DRAFT_1164330 [Mycena latifolia]